MKIIGLTGGIGSGKSAVAEIMKKEYDAYVILTDVVGHQVMSRGEPGYTMILREFGEQVLDPSGQIDRKILSGIVFCDEQKRRILNDCVHPLIWANVQGQISILKKCTFFSYIVLEAALLHEAGFQVMCDETWNVTAPQSVRMQRLKSSRGLTEEAVEAMMSKQYAPERYEKLCDFTIENHDMGHTLIQINRRLQNRYGGL